MPQKIYLSFLGTNNYINCNYYAEGDKNKQVKNVKYVQEALLQMYCQDFTENDVAYFFLTKDARKQNWENDSQWNRETGKYDLSNTGLLQRLQEMKGKGLFKGRIEAIAIPEGFSSDEIWRIFQLVFDALKKGDEVTLDITHAFRSLPMLGMVLVNYAKSLKNIQIKAIYYGAFEKLGPAPKVAKMDIETRNAPVLNLISFAELQEWTAAAAAFERSGDSAGIVNLTAKKIAPILKTTKGNSPSARSLNSLSTSLGLLTGILTTNRGNNITKGLFVQNINNSLSNIKKNKKIIPALRPILDKIKDKLETFNSNTPNWLAAVGWCIEHNLIQQGITQLQEGLLSHFCHIENNFFINLNQAKEEHRTIISQAMLIIQKEIPEEKWYKPASKNIAIVNALIENDKIKQLSAPYQSLTKLRNDINHGGYLSQKTPDKFKSELKGKFELIKEILKIT